MCGNTSLLITVACSSQAQSVARDQVCYAFVTRCSEQAKPQASWGRSEFQHYFNTVLMWFQQKPHLCRHRMPHLCLLSSNYSTYLIPRQSVSSNVLTGFTHCKLSFLALHLAWLVEVSPSMCLRTFWPYETVVKVKHLRGALSFKKKKKI